MLSKSPYKWFKAKKNQNHNGFRKVPWGLVLSSMVWAVPMALANGYGESGSWGFQSQQDKVNKAYVLDLYEKNKNGYYNPIESTYNYTTY